MSKLSRNIKAMQTRESIPMTETIHSFDGYQSWDDLQYAGSHAYIYDLGVKLGVRQAVSDQAIKQGGTALEEIVRVAKAKILEEVFGEFRNDFYSARAAIACGDRRSAEEAIKNIMDAMYDY